jgi:hypothetical protein
VIVIVAVIAADPVIVAVHLHGNASRARDRSRKPD